MKNNEVIGKRFGKLVVIKLLGTKKYRQIVLAQCDCNSNIKEYVLNRLKTGNTKSCGCKKKDRHKNNHFKKIKTLIGCKFGRLTIIQTGKLEENKQRWKVIVKCECGTKKECVFSEIKSGKIQSCGCLLRELKYKHGLSYHPLNEVHGNMKQRCYNPGYISYHNYGERWLGDNGLQNFHDDMISTWKDGLSLDRIDNNKGYSKENCRWATRTEQSRNKRNNILITFNNETKTLSEWAEIHNISVDALRYRVKIGWSNERLFYPSQRKKEK